MSKKWNIIYNETTELMSCGLCKSKTFTKINSQKLVCAYCSTSFTIYDKLLTQVQIVPNKLGRYPYNN